jgi:DNA polymerase-3 subunit gamma/tau
MTTQALYRRWRSQTFDEVVGQEHVTHTLRNALRDGRMSHAYLFTGPRGTGKTSTARILAKAINCLDGKVEARPCNTCAICAAITEGRLLDLIEIDAASNRGIDEIRELRERIGFRPGEARYKVYIIDEVHMLTKEAFNALLKTLEEPPPHAVFVLATTEPDRVPETVRSRCQRFDFRRIPAAEIAGHLGQVLAAEERQATPDALAAIARRATGSMRDAVSLLDQMLSYGDELLEVERVAAVLGLVDAETIGRLVAAMARQDAGAGLALLNAMVAEGVELGQLTEQVLAYLRGVLVARVARVPASPDIPEETHAAMMRLAEQFTPEQLLAATREFSEARVALRDQVPGVPQLPLELAFLRCVYAMSAPVQPAAARADPPGRSTAPTAATLPRQGPAAELPPPPAPNPEPGAGAQDAWARWDALLALAKERYGIKIQAALRAVRALDWSGEVLVMQFTHEFHRDLVGQGENRVNVEALWREVLGRPVTLRCTVAGEREAAAPPPQGAPADDDQALLDEARKMGAVVKPLGKDARQGP